MGIIRDSFIIFKNWAEAINALPEENQLETYKALIEYGLHGQMPQDISPVSKAMLISFSVGMENSIAKYNASVENGKLGGRPPKDKNLNKNNAQLIYTAHSTFLLNSDDLRRDEVYLVEKDKYGKSSLYSLAEFKNLRVDADYEKKYLTGQFGAIPYENEAE